VPAELLYARKALRSRAGAGSKTDNKPVNN
jgi:hypothetical protein